MMINSRKVLGSWFLLVCCAIAGQVKATTYGEDPSIEAALRHADSVVSGYFSASAESAREVVKNVTNEKGEFEDLTVEYRVYDFTVDQVIDGEDVPKSIRINVRGPLQVPTPKERVVVGLSKDLETAEGGFSVLYSQIMSADSDADLERARELTKASRLAPEEDKQEMIDRLGEDEMAQRHAPPVAPDDPDPEKQPDYSGPSKSGPAETQPKGKNTHPEEDQKTPDKGQ